MEEFFGNEKDASSVSERTLYTASAFAKSALLYLQEAGRLKAKRIHTSHRANLSSYLFFAVTSGSGKFVYDGIEYRLTSGDCVFIDCRVPYSHTTDKTDLWQLEWVHFNGNQMPAIYSKYMSRGGKPVLRPKDVSQFCEIISNIFAIAKTDDHIRDMRINAEISDLLMLLMNETVGVSEKSDRKGKKDLLPVKIYLDEHYPEKISLDDLANRFFINKYYLVKRFKEQYGVSVNSYLADIRVTRAKQMLRFTDKKVETVGLECGLGALSYFSRTFKKIEGISPKEYREKWQG